MASKRSSRNRHKAQHHTDKGHQKRVLKYVNRELRRMQQLQTGFRVHPEFGWCHKMLFKLGYMIDFDAPAISRKVRPVCRVHTENFPPPTWGYNIKRKQLVLLTGTSVTYFGPSGPTFICTCFMAIMVYSAERWQWENSSLYTITISEIRVTLSKYKAAENDDSIDGKDPSYLLWMCNQIECMNSNSVADVLKASRWIGWILAHMEMHHGWNNQRSRNVIRCDSVQLVSFLK